MLAWHGDYLVMTCDAQGLRSGRSARATGRSCLLMMTYEDGYNAGQVEHEVKDGYIRGENPTGRKYRFDGK